LNKLALTNAEPASMTRTMQQQTSKFQLKSKFTQLKLLNSSKCDNTSVECRHSAHELNADARASN